MASRKLWKSDWLFKPVVKLMARLSFARKSLILVIIVIFSFLIITFQLFDRVSLSVYEYEKELQGFILCPQVKNMVKLLQQHRGLSAGFLGGEVSYFKTELQTKQIEIIRQIQSLKTLNSSQSRLDWFEIKNSWQEIVDKGKLWNIKDNFSKHTVLIQKVRNLSGIITDDYGLTTHTDSALNSVLHELSDTQEFLGQIRGLGTGILAKKEISKNNQNHISDLIVLTTHSINKLNMRLNDMGKNIAKSNKITLVRQKAIIQDTKHIFKLVEANILSKNYQISAKSFYVTSTEIINKTYDEILLEFINKTKINVLEKISVETNVMINSVLVMLFVFIILAYILIGIYISGKNSISNISNAALDFAKGDFNKRIHLEEPEFKPLINSFNYMADELIYLINEQQEARSRLNAIIDSSLDAMIQINAGGEIIGWSHQAEVIFGWEYESVIGKLLHQFIIPKRYHEAHLRSIAHFVATRNKTITGKRVEIEGLHKDGHEFPIELSVSPIKTKEGYEFTAFIRDISSRKRAEEKLQMFAHVFSGTHQGVMIVDSWGLILDVNPAFSRITDYKREEVLGKNPNLLSSGKQDEKFYKRMWEIIEETGHWQGEMWNRKKNGEIYAELLTISSIKDSKNKITNYIGLFSDITHKMQQEKELKLMAYYDVLTNLPNRILFTDRFAQAVSYCKRNETLLAVCFLDVDQFKPINDSYGHSVGDQVLIEVAKRILANLREADTVSRFGGDEFAILIGEFTHLYQCEQLLDRIIDGLSKPYLIQGHKLNISFSIGCTIYPDDDSDMETLLRHADRAMYQAKSKPNIGYCLYHKAQD